MRMPKSFSRYKTVVPAGGVVLGTDVVPNGANGADGTAPSPTTDNLLFMRFANNAGWPLHRVAVGYNYRGAGVAIALPASLYLWDALTQRWYLTTTANLTADKIVFFDSVALIDPMASQTDATRPSAGSLEALLIVTDPGAAPSGEHRFALGADLSLYG